MDFYIITYKNVLMIYMKLCGYWCYGVLKFYVNKPSNLVKHQFTSDFQNFRLHCLAKFTTIG